MLGPGEDAPRSEQPLAAELQGSPRRWPPEGAEELDSEFLYDRLAEAGYGYGPSFQGLRQRWQVGDELYAEVALEEAAASRRQQGFCIHPALSDAALHALLLEALDLQKPGAVEVPFSFSGVRLYGQGASSLRVRLTSETQTTDTEPDGAR